MPGANGDALRIRLRDRRHFVSPHPRGEGESCAGCRSRLARGLRRWRCKKQVLARCSLSMNRTRKLLEMNECSKTGSWAQGAIKVRGDLSPRERVRVRGKRREGPARILGHSETARVLPDPFMISSFAFAEVHLPFVASEAAAPPGSGRRVSFRRSTRVPSIVWTRNS